jgi:hypothetical protein
MDLLQGLENGITQSNFALNAKLAPLAGFCRVEGVSGQSVGKGGHGSSPIDFSLSALGLELIKNSS